MIVYIPTVDKDERIGSVFNEVFSVIAQTESCANECVWNFKHCHFMHPFFLVPLALYRASSEKRILLQNIPPTIANYLKVVNFSMPLEITDSNYAILEQYIGRTYTPICAFTPLEEISNSLQSILTRIIKHRLPDFHKIEIPLSYLMGELVCNIEQHSKSDKGYIFCQYLQQERCISVCIADAGDTIFASYARTNTLLDEIQDNEALALQKACNGCSTKGIPERGFGLPSSKSLLVDGLKGSFFLLSGTAFHRHSQEGLSYIALPENLRWNGTIALLRIPIDIQEGFDYLKYIS